MPTTIRNTAMTVAAVGAAALGGSAIAGAADNGTTAGSVTSSSKQSRPDRPPRETLSSGERREGQGGRAREGARRHGEPTEAGGPYSTPYHAHVTTSDGKRRVVLVDAQFAATAVQAEKARGGSGPGGRHGGRGGLVRAAPARPR